MLRHFLIYITLVLFSAALPAQEHFLLSVDRNDVMIGDPVKLKIDLQLAPGTTIRSLKLSFDKASLIPPSTASTPGQLTPVPEANDAPDFEIRNLGKWTTLPDSRFTIPAAMLIWDTLSAGNTTILTNTLELIPWDAGLIRFPPMSLRIDQREITSNAIELKVNTPEAPATINPQDSMSLAPIKEIKEEPFRWQDFLPLLLLGFLLAAVAALTWSFLRKRKTVIPPPPATRWIPVHDLAIAQLEDLQTKRLWQQGEVKAYQSELTHIVREYLENRYYIQALESPTSEILRQMQPLQFSEEHKKQLEEMLQMADMVKFAKAQPEVSVHDREMETALDFVRKTQIVELVDEEKEGWMEVAVDKNEGSVAYQLVRASKVRKRITKSPSDFIKFEEAKFGRRLAANLIDIVLVTLLLGLLAYLINFVPMPEAKYAFYAGIGSLIFSLLMLWIYFVEMEVRRGATLGKRLLFLQTMNATQDNVSRIEAAIRLVLKGLALNLFPFFIIYTLIKKSQVLLHDNMTDTRVYYVKK